MRWSDMKNQLDADGNLTPVAMALDSIEGYGCDCNREDGQCVTCLCEDALKAQWHELNNCYDLIGTLKQKIVEMEHENAPVQCYSKEEVRELYGSEMGGHLLTEDPPITEFTPDKNYPAIPTRCQKCGEVHIGSFLDANGVCEKCWSQSCSD